MITLGIVTVVFVEALILAQGQAQGWSFYLTTTEVWFEVWVRMVASALAGAALGTIVTLLLLPVLWFLPARRGRIVEIATKAAVVLVVFFVSRFVLQKLIGWSYRQWGIHSGIYDKLLLWGQVVVFVVALAFSRTRKALVTGMDGFLSEKMTRRMALATVGSAAALMVTEYALGKRLPMQQQAASGARPKPNFLLVTFDALCAEDLSLYGSKLPTSPNIDAFARKSTVFNRFYSASTFTTPAVATIMTGLYPSDNLVYHLQGSLRPSDAQQSLPHLMRSAGFATGAFLTNPYAYFFAQSAENEFDTLPEPSFPTGSMQDFWNATSSLHQNSGFGSRLDEYKDLEATWAYFGRVPINRSIRYRPTAAFEDARRILGNLPDGFFLWIHVVTPHHPYIPDPADRDRFLPDSVRVKFQEELTEKWQPHYPSSAQGEIDQQRLAYDEFVATGDRAFGAFMEDLQRSGRLENMTVIVSADHGESFEGGVFEHRTPYLTRPVIHVPLIIRTPGQQQGGMIEVTADQTSLPPTILELAGLPVPATMRGPSLARWLNGAGDGAGEGRAFTQYFDRNSVYKPLKRGSIGVIDSEYEYVIYLDSKKGELRPLDRAQEWDLDVSSQFPERAETMRSAIATRFSGILGKQP